MNNSVVAEAKVVPGQNIELSITAAVGSTAVAHQENGTAHERDDRQRHVTRRRGTDSR
jgi:hypothetical protein